MNKITHLSCSIALFFVLVAGNIDGDVYDRCKLIDDNTVIVKFKGGVSIKLVRKGDNIFLQQKSPDDGKWLASIDDHNAFKMIKEFVKLGRFSGCRRRLFSPRKSPVLKKPRKLYRNAWFF